MYTLLTFLNNPINFHYFFYSIPTSPNCNLPPMTPSTIEFYSKEAKLSGLPVIPFAYPTCVLVDRMKNKTKDEQILSENAKNNSAIKKKSSNISDEMTETEVPKSPPGTLESIGKNYALKIYDQFALNKY